MAFAERRTRQMGWFGGGLREPAAATTWKNLWFGRLDIPPIAEFIEMLDDADADLYGCQIAMDMFKLTEDDLLAQVKDVITAMDFMDMSEGAQIVFI